MNKEIAQVRTVPPFSAAAEIERLVVKFRTVDPLAKITHEEMSETIGESSRSPRGRNIVSRARERIQRENGYVFRAINGVGYERVDDQGKEAIAGKDIKSINRKVSRTESVLDTITIERLEQRERENHVLNMTLIRMIKQASSGKFGRAVQKRISDSTANLDSINLLRLFGKTQKSANPLEK